MTAADQTPATDSPKMLRETLCVAQMATLRLRSEDPRASEHIARLQQLIDDLDKQRPLGPDGKHGNRHTPTCGCEDTPATDSERVGRLGAEAIEDLTAMIGSEQADTLYMPMGMAVALRAEHARLTALLAEQAATIERLDFAAQETDWPAVSRALAVARALGSQRTEGQG